MKKFLPALVLLFLSSVLFWPVAVFGLNPGSGDNPIGVLPSSGVNPGAQGSYGNSTDILTTDLLVEKIMRIVNWFAWFIAVASVIMGLYSGMLFITSGGNTTQLDTARKILMYTVIGIIVAIISFSIVIITKTFVGVA